MNIKLATTAPFPWLNCMTGILFGKKDAQTGRRKTFFGLPRSLSVTREGKWYIGVLFLIGLAAINTGNNLLYLVVAAMLSFIIVSGILSETTMRGVRIRRELPAHIFKGQPASIRYRITNRKKYLPSYSFFIVEIDLPGLKADPAYVLKLKAKDEAIKTGRVVFDRRGKVALRGVNISTRFPFGIFLKGKSEMDSMEALVYPAMKRVSISAVNSISRNVNASDRDLMAIAKGGGTELRALRDYVSGEDARFIYWKSAAKRQKLLVKEFEKETERKVMVVLDNHSNGDAAAFEERIDEAAGVINHFIERGYLVGLKTLGEDCPPAPGGQQLLTLLKVLALVEPVKGGRPALSVIYI